MFHNKLRLFLKRNSKIEIAKFFNHNFNDDDFKLYDNNGNLIYFEISNGYWYKREHDQHNNIIYYENSDGYIEDNRPKTTCENKTIEIEGVKYKLIKE